MIQRLAILLLFLSLFLPVSQILAGDKKDKKSESAKEKVVKTNHSITIKGKKLHYTATTGTLVLRDDKGKPRAGIFFIAYTKDDADSQSRPITFAWNGGPGSSSVWLHLGLFGPKRILMKENGSPFPPPCRLVDNDWSILDQTDVVMVDPVSTGFSRPAEGKKRSEFHGVRQDIETASEFIRVYLSRFGRWNSPKFIAGESYGTTRAAGVAEHLQSRHGINLNGVILVSAVLNFQTIRFDEGNDLPYVLFLPGYTATAWYHKKLDPKLQGSFESTLNAAEKFAEEEYAVALFKGNRLSKKEQHYIAHKMAYYTGLSEEYILQSNLRVNARRFFKELLRDQRRTVGRFDSRFLGKDSEAAGESPQYDPSYAVVQGPFTATLNHYVRSELKYKSDDIYEILTGKVRPWDYGSAKNRYVNVSRDLSRAMTQNPYLKVFVANGYYDLATPYFATEYTMDHLPMDSSLIKNVDMKYYKAGHMMYIQRSSLIQMNRDLSAFFTSALPNEKK